MKYRKTWLKVAAGLGALILALWLWQAAQQWFTLRRLREIVAGLGTRVVSVTPSPTVVVQRLQALHRWETARFVSQHVVEARSESSWLPPFLGDERLLLIATAEVIAGVDMERLSPNDVQWQDNRLVITLPPPQILSVRLDEAKTQVFTRERGWLVFNPDPNLEQAARLQALQEARQAALQSELLSFAAQKAEENLRSFLKAMGFEQVEVRWQQDVNQEHDGGRRSWQP